jgi:hypothetical protein
MALPSGRAIVLLGCIVEPIGEKNSLLIAENNLSSAHSGNGGE